MDHSIAENALKPVLILGWIEAIFSSPAEIWFRRSNLQFREFAALGSVWVSVALLHEGPRRKASPE